MTYVPQVGDRVSVEGVVAGFDRVSEPTVLVTFEGGGTWFLAAAVTLISRPERPLEVGETVTSTEWAEAKLRILAIYSNRAWLADSNDWTVECRLSSLTRVQQP